jgi:hypothetical protein
MCNDERLECDVPLPNSFDLNHPVFVVRCIRTENKIMVQGGAIAAVAAVYLADLNPYVFTFGQPPTLDEHCPLVTSDRWYRYVNTESVQAGTVGIAYDPVPFFPALVRTCATFDCFLKLFLLSDWCPHRQYTFPQFNVAGSGALRSYDHPL